MSTVLAGTARFGQLIEIEKSRVLVEMLIAAGSESSKIHLQKVILS
jgi:hypothetical protein